MKMAIIMVMPKNDDIAISCRKSNNNVNFVDDIDNAFDEMMMRELVSYSNLFQFEGLSISHLVLDILPVLRGRRNIEYHI
jgi:hypothetical protein